MQGKESSPTTLYGFCRRITYVPPKETSKITERYNNHFRRNQPNRNAILTSRTSKGVDQTKIQRTADKCKHKCKPVTRHSGNEPTKTKYTTNTNSGLKIHSPITTDPKEQPGTKNQTSFQRQIVTWSTQSQAVSSMIGRTRSHRKPSNPQPTRGIAICFTPCLRAC